MIVCNDTALGGSNSTSDGRKWGSCLEYLEKSAYVDPVSGGNDLYWFLCKLYLQPRWYAGSPVNPILIDLNQKKKNQDKKRKTPSHTRFSTPSTRRLVELQRQDSWRKCVGGFSSERFNRPCRFLRAICDTSQPYLLANPQDSRSRFVESRALRLRQTSQRTGRAVLRHHMSYFIHYHVVILSVDSRLCSLFPEKAKGYSVPWLLRKPRGSEPRRTFLSFFGFL